MPSIHQAIILTILLVDKVRQGFPDIFLDLESFGLYPYQHRSVKIDIILVK